MTTSDAQAYALGRLNSFSDGVFAIAITLLIFNMKLDDGWNGDLPQLWAAIEPQVFAYVISFWVIGLYWDVHRQIFQLMRGLDARAVVFNLLFLALVCFLPFPTSLIGRLTTPATVTFYSLSVILIGLASGLLWYHVAFAARLIDPKINEAQRRAVMGLRLIVFAVFALSLIPAQTQPGLAMLSWSSLLVLIPLVRRFTGINRLGDLAG